MTYTSDRAAGRVATRPRRRQHQKVRHIRRHRSPRRVLHEEAATNVEECHDVLFNHRFARYPNVKSGSEAGPSSNRFSVLDPGWSSKILQTITPLHSSITFSSSNPCSSSAQNSSSSLLLSPIPTTPPSHPMVKLPETVSKDRPRLDRSGSGLHCTSNEDCRKSQQNPFELPPIPSPFLYHNESRDMLPGIDGSDNNLASSSVIDCGQQTQDQDSQSFRVDLAPLDVGGRQAQPDCNLEPTLNDEPLFIGAALPDMSKAVPGQATTVASPDADFYRYTRSYLSDSGKAVKDPAISNEITASDAGSGTAEAKEPDPPILTTTNTFPRWLRTMTHVFPEPYSHVSPLTPPSTSMHRRNAAWDKQGLWEPIISPRVQQQIFMPGLIFPKLTPSPVCERHQNSRCMNTADGCARRLISFWEDNCNSRPRTTKVGARTMCSNLSLDAAASEVTPVLNATQETMDKKPAYLAQPTIPAGLWIQPDTPQAPDSRWGWPSHMLVPTCQSELHRLHKSPIRSAAIPSVIKSGALSETSTIDVVVSGLSSAYNAPVPSAIYEHQYLGWPSRRTEQDIVYQDKTWPSLGACIPLLQREAASEVPNVEVGASKGTDPLTQIDTSVEPVMEHLNMHMDQGGDGQYTKAWLQALTGPFDFTGVRSDDSLYNLFEEAALEDATDPVKEDVANYAVAEGDLVLSQFHKVEETLSSGVSWSEIASENENEEDWLWSDDDLEA